MLTNNSHPIRTRGPLELRSDHTLLLHGHEIEAIGITTDPEQLQVRTTEHEQLQPLASADFFFIITGTDSMPDEQAQRLFRAYLLVREHLSELVEISAIKQEIHPACLALLLHHESGPFFVTVAQAAAWLADLRKLPPLQVRDVAQLFAACLIATSRLEALLDAFEKAHLGPFVSQIAEGNVLLDITRRAQQTVASISSIIRAEEPQEPPQKEQEGARRYRQSDVLCLLLLALLGLCSWWLHRR